MRTNGHAQVTIIGRSEEDELLLLASDGLWDVLTNQEAVNLAQRCLKRARQRGASRQAAARVAASVLTRAAVDQGSSDNVTVVVVDLSRCVCRLTACATSHDIQRCFLSKYQFIALQLLWLWKHRTILCLLHPQGNACVSGLPAALMPSDCRSAGAPSPLRSPPA